MLSEIFESETGWLSLTNAALGLAVLVLLVAVGRVVLHEVFVWVAMRPQVVGKRIAHSLNLESLGIRLTDGGDPINELTRRETKKTDPDDPPNIIRSEN
jgi:hypothetical protein